MNQRWKRFAKERGDKAPLLTKADKLRFLSESPEYARSRSELEAMSVEIEGLASFEPLRLWVHAVERVIASLSTLPFDAPVLWTYSIDQENALASSSCSEDGAGWTRLILDQSTAAAQTRTGSWTKGGTWDGAFAQIIGGADDLKDLLADGGSIQIGFCNVRYVSVVPGAWFDPSLLHLVDSGILRVRQESKFSGGRILGENGLIPRTVTGLLLAGRVQIDLRLAPNRLASYRRSVSGSRTVRIGPWNIDNNGAHAVWRGVESNATKNSEAMETTGPVIIALVTELTSNN